MSNYLQILDYENNQSEQITDPGIEVEETKTNEMTPESIFDSFQTIKEICKTNQ